MRSCPSSFSPLRLLLGLALLSAPLIAQEESLRLEAVRFSEPPAVDGQVLADPAWDGVAPATSFVQQRPDQGKPATEQTEVRVGFDDQNFYLAVVCFDSEPGSLSISDSRRDPELQGEDSIRVVLDTFGDRQNGFVFGTNIAGAQYDGQMTNQGRGQTPSGNNGPQGGGTANLDWDTTWDVQTSIHDEGWSAEFAIPFRSLRYGTSPFWGINVERNVRRKSEISFWAPLGREFDLFRVSAAGDLTGLEPPKRKSLQLIPYALASGRDDGTTDDTDTELGLDLKYSVTPSLTLDVTVNTDFAQVEADDQQVNLDRFSLFFPEKRPFFLENAGFFRVGTTGPRFPGSGFVDLFFSRRIGLLDGQQVPIEAGVRLSGRAAGFNVGFLNMQTEELGSELQANNFGVARLSREFGNRGRIGFIGVNREGTGDLAPERDYNRAYAIDGQIGLGRYNDITAFASKTDTPGRRDEDHSFAVEWRQEAPRWRNRFSYSEVAPDFNPEVGFINRTNYRRITGNFSYRIRPESGGRIQEWGPQLYIDEYRGFDNFEETRRASTGLEMITRAGGRISLFVGDSREALREPFEIFDGIVLEPGAYPIKNPYYFIFFNTNPGRAVSLGGRIVGGGFFSGRQFSTNPTVNFRLGDYLSAEVGWSNNHVRLREGDFETNLGRLRLTYSFSPRVLLQALIQYNDVADEVSTNLRFSWLGTANTGLFVVYNEISEFGMLGLQDPDRSLIVKYSYLFDVFR